jgi:hypothetical protein
MYDVGQGDNIKKGSGEVFTIKLKDTVADTLYPCHFDTFDPSQQPKQIPLGAFDKRILDDYNGYKSLQEEYAENYEKTTQHTNAGELSDMTLLILISIVCMVLVYFCFFKK